ncbi:DUF7848 domain-containing protein [Streptomyces sulfonofaciens]|uniref:DUF7848 domain-containing protein n=1 Tax=Streptomyces sulfonofaciens TaxID=68272 RepID=UPI004032D2DC
MSIQVLLRVSACTRNRHEPQHWVLRHCGQNPSHHIYRELITRPWRAWRQM